MTLTQFFYITNNETKVFCYNKFCIHPKKTKVYKRLLKFMQDDNNIIGIGFEYYLEKTGTKVTHKNLK
jgi:hypothetical protein